jgi:RNA polymerase sigma factor (sigma-70 family)
MEQRLRSEFDSADFLQQVWQSFFAGDLGDYDFDTPESLVAFLVRVAEGKVRDGARRVLSKKRDANPVPNENAVSASQVAGPQPTPSQEVMAKDCLQQMVDGEPPHVRRLLEMLRQGHTHAAVAAELGVSERSVHRVLNRLYKRHRRT